MDESKKTYIIERIAIGNSVKVSAIDPETGTEVCIITPRSLPEHDQGTLAIHKLEYVLKKRLVK